MLSLRKKRPEPSRYLTEAYYDALMAWQTAAQSYGPSEDAAVRTECEALLLYEARLLDTRQFEAWLNLLTEDCVYWVPADIDADPRTVVTVSFDDRRRLEDRIIRLETGFAHNQLPDRRMRRMITNVEAWEAEDGYTRRVMANEHVFEHRTGKPRIEYVAGLDYWLEKVGPRWLIKVKQVKLLNSLDGLDTPTLL
ncbi:MAG: aromatic-ring-hydroxylating dioxygenase subunit beta [Pseudomonadota bacterium]